MRSNGALEAWRLGRQTIGGWLSIGNAYSAEVMAHLGFDWLCIDMQHGMIGYQDLKSMLPAISTTGVTPLVRVPWNDPATIMKTLDAGAYGVIVPMINGREDVLKAISACRYPPEGQRSFGPIRAALYGGKGYAGEANSQMACIAMIETRQALDNLEEIVTTPGLDGLYIGPSDLALALGLAPAGDNNDPTHVETVSHIFNTCRSHGLAVGIHTWGLEYTRRYLDQGFQFVTLGSDSGFMARKASAELREARSVLK